MRILQEVVSPDEVRTIRDAWNRKSNSSQEIYESSDGENTLVLHYSHEPAWSGALFKGELVQNEARKKIPLPGLFQSGGEGGARRTVFSGSPFSPDSTRLALLDQLSDSCRLRCWGVKDILSRFLRLQRPAQYFSCEFQNPMLFHSWSPGSDYCLLQGLGSWTIVNHKGELEAKIETECPSFPAHAAFLTSGDLLLFSEETEEAAIHPVGAWPQRKPVKKITARGPVFTLPEPSGRGLIVGPYSSLEHKSDGEDRWFLIGID